MVVGTGNPMSEANAHDACCNATAREDATATYCMECGKPLLRCMAFQECGGIVDDSGLCPVCVHPSLQIIPGATMTGSVGGAVAVPFELVNNSRVDRPLFIKGLWSRENGNWRPERLGWAKLLPGERGEASVTACELARSGLHEIEIMFAVATQWRTRQEQFAFSARVQLEIPQEIQAEAPTIQISSQNQMNGNVIKVEMPDGARNSTRLIERFEKRIKRLDVEERAQGLRGLDEALRIPRSATFEFEGFRTDTAPPRPAPIVTPDAMLVFGRSSTRELGGEADVQLLAYDPQGQPDSFTSALMSRRHFELYIENERPVIRVAGGNGVRVNGTAYGPDKSITLHDGDVIDPIVNKAGQLSLHLRFRRELDTIARVIVTRSPAEPGKAEGRTDA